MLRIDQRSALDSPDHVVRRWSRWLKARGLKGSLEELEQAYLESEDYDNWSHFLASMGYLGNFEAQQQDFWKDFSSAFREPPTKLQRAVHYLAATSFGVWFIQKYLGMKGRIAA